MPKQYYQGKPIGYNIIYHPVDFESDFKLVSVNYTTNTTNLTELDVYTKYDIYVSAVSSGGVGPAEMTMARTDAEGKKVKVRKVELNLRFNASGKLKCCAR